MAKIEKTTAPMTVDLPTSSGEKQVVVSYPKTFEDIQKLILNLRNGQSVIFKLTGITNSMAQRMIDFMSGAAYAVGGSMRAIEENLFLVTHQGVGITVNK